MAAENMTGFNPIKLYTSEGTLTGYHELYNNFNNGCGFCYIVGHGCPILWTNHLPNSEERIEPFGVFQIMKLKNRDKLPIFVVSGCHNSQFDISIFGVLNKTKYGRGEGFFECFSWLATKKINGGSIATIGCSALGHTKEDKESFEGGINEMEVEFFKQYAQNGQDIIGDAWREAVSWHINTYNINWESINTNDDWVDIQVPSTWILFGDPSLKIGGYN
jgi:hypothetical protein